MLRDHPYRKRYRAKKIKRLFPCRSKTSLSPKLLGNKTSNSYINISCDMRIPCPTDNSPHDWPFCEDLVVNILTSLGYEDSSPLDFSLLCGGSGTCDGLEFNIEKDISIQNINIECLRSIDSCVGVIFQASENALICQL